VRRISASDAAKLAALRAEVHELELARLREEAAERKARTRRQNALMAIVAAGVVVLVLASGITYVATVPTGVMATEPTMVRAPVGDPQRKSDPRFNETGKGIVRYAEGEGRRCRQVDFNNRSGRFSNEALVACYDPKTQDISSRMPQAQVGDAFDQMRNSFRR
jgi:hypothetical protein